MTIINPFIVGMETVYLLECSISSNKGQETMAHRPNAVCGMFLYGL